jgi:hypothetical protein
MIMLDLLLEFAHEKVFEAPHPVDGGDSNFLYLPFRYPTEPSEVVEIDV